MRKYKVVIRHEIVGWECSLRLDLNEIERACRHFCPLGCCVCVKKE